MDKSQSALTVDRREPASAEIGLLVESSPGDFAFVMATGIVSIASELLGFPRIARVLLVINLVAYAAIWIMQLARLVRSPRAMLADLRSHERGASFLTVVAATSLVGSQCHLFLGAEKLALALWWLAIALWVVLVNAWFAAAVLVDPKPPLDRGIDGSWLLLCVSTESLAILGSYVTGQFPDSELCVFVSLAAYMLGAMFYLWIIGLVLLRWFFSPMNREGAFSPAYWINSGAMAITTLAGARLTVMASSHVQSLEHFLEAFNLLFWVTATWWLPLLLVMEVWQLLAGRVRLRYAVDYWSMVFPLGMYAACTWAYAQSADLPFLKPIAMVGLSVAWTAWAFTALGMFLAVLRELRTR